MNALMEKELVLEPLIENLKEIGLYDPSAEQQLRSALGQRQDRAQLLVQHSFSGVRVNFTLYIGFGKDDGAYLERYSVGVPAAYQVPAHLVHNGIDSAELDSRMGKVDWYSGPGWLHREDYLHEDYRGTEVGTVFRQLYRFAQIGEGDDWSVRERVQGMVHFLAYRHLENSVLHRCLSAGQGELSQLFHREIAFPAWVHARVPGNRMGQVSELDRLSELAFLNHNKNREIMNLNNLEVLKGEMEKLGFSNELMAKMEDCMKADLPIFTLHDQVQASKGAVELTLYFKQSGKSDFYYLNRIEAVHNQGMVLQPGEHYRAMEHLSDGTYRPVGEPMDSFYMAAHYFRAMEANAALTVFKDQEMVMELARKEDGVVNDLHQEIKKEFNTPSIPQVFWIENGKGFEREQVANLMQGRAVYREELLNREGHLYNAWMQLDNDKARDTYGNLGYRQYTDGYGYDVKSQLQEYKIVGVDNAKKLDVLVYLLKQGARPEVQVEKDGQKTKLFLETAVRYGKLNFYREDGRPEKREQFLKEAGVGVGAVMDKNQDKQKENAQGVGL